MSVTDVAELYVYRMSSRIPDRFNSMQHGKDWLTITGLQRTKAARHPPCNMRNFADLPKNNDYAFPFELVKAISYRAISFHNQASKNWI
ncbi:hypothetical protein BOTNAR_0129g00100 [Botryotinia narcissicola]|uniref:Uncharacterized protein n=1 Tax=Botryotinia narcissicola TaxID=278944 RepID=A0A4Z1IIB2_9HELO|nr:hypothetical protein BOTNAR_0129g00100 [Botryotinia narcissicola]